MLIRIASDIHIDAFTGRDPSVLANDFLSPDDRDAESVLVLAGDISSKIEQLISFLQVCEQRFYRVIFVPGNHELYRHVFENWNDEFTRCAKEFLSPRTFVTSADQVSATIIDGVRFVYGTMWADGGPTLADQAKTGYYLNDFRLIRTAGGMKSFSVPLMMEEFRRARASIEGVLNYPFDGKTVVVTHHLPSRKLVSDRFWPSDGSDGANGGFVGDCDDLLSGDHAPDLWIHGHTHCKIDTVLWKTRVVCNPTGYRGEWTLPDVGGQPTFIEV